jgi:dTDP-4-dehydrorhamnose reductase
MLKAIVLGSEGMLGRDVVAALTALGRPPVALDIADLDLTDPSAVARIASGEFGEASWCVNCAAYTAVDRAEEERDAAYTVNAVAPGYVAQACLAAGMRLLHISTDFVFDGEAREPYDEDAAPNPLGVYGKSKLEGEEAVIGRGALVVRTAWLYGPHGKCFPKAMLNAWKAGRTLRVVADQFGCPTYTAELARVVADLMETEAPAGIYHAAGAEIMSWHVFAQTALNAYADLHGEGPAPVIEAIRTEDWPTLVRRPKFSALSFAKCTALGIAPMRPTADCLRDFWSRLSVP